jgi:hypothetical protein
MDREGKRVRSQNRETASNNKYTVGKVNGKLFNSSFKAIIFGNKIRPLHLREFI